MGPFRVYGALKEICCRSLRPSTSYRALSLLPAQFFLSYRTFFFLRSNGTFVLSLFTKFVYLEVCPGNWRRHFRRLFPADSNLKDNSTPSLKNKNALFNSVPKACCYVTEELRCVFTSKKPNDSCSKSVFAENSSIFQLQNSARDLKWPRN